MRVALPVWRDVLNIFGRMFRQQSVNNRGGKLHQGVCFGMNRHPLVVAFVM